MFHRSQQVVDPSAMMKFPFKTPLRDHATKYLMFKYEATESAACAAWSKTRRRCSPHGRR